MDILTSFFPIASFCSPITLANLSNTILNKRYNHLLLFQTSEEILSNFSWSVSCWLLVIYSLYNFEVCPFYIWFVRDINCEMMCQGISAFHVFMDMTILLLQFIIFVICKLGISFVLLKSHALFLSFFLFLKKKFWCGIDFCLLRFCWLSIILISISRKTSQNWDN